MGRRGPTPKPTANMKLHDSRTLYDRVDEPEPDMARPTCPSWLDAKTKAAWRRVVERLDHMGLLSATDTDALTRYCVMLIRWRNCEEFIVKNGDTYPIRDKNGKVTQFSLFPQVGEAGRLAERLLRMEQNFGLTPSARARLAYDNGRNRPPTANDKRKFFKVG